MKIPAVAIAAAFASGIVLGQSGLFAPRETQRFFLAMLLGVTCGLLSLALFLVWRNLLWPSACTSLLCWAVLGLWQLA